MRHLVRTDLAVARLQLADLGLFVGRQLYRRRALSGGFRRARRAAAFKSSARLRGVAITCA
jgi:hypothetical protein